MYAPEESCRIAIKREGTLANEVGELKYVRVERKIHV